MKKGLALTILIILGLSAMITTIKNKEYTPFNTQKELAYTLYEDNLTTEEKTDIGLMGISSLKKLVDTVNGTFKYANKVIKWVTNFLDKKEDFKDWWEIPITVPNPFLPRGKIK